MNHPIPKRHILATVAPTVIKFAGHGQNRLKFTCTKLGINNATIDQDTPQSPMVYFTVDTV